MSPRWYFIPIASTLVVATAQLSWTVHPTIFPNTQIQRLRGLTITLNHLALGLQYVLCPRSGRTGWNFQHRCGFFRELHRSVDYHQLRTKQPETSRKSKRFPMARRMNLHRQRRSCSITLLSWITQAVIQLLFFLSLSMVRVNMINDHPSSLSWSHMGKALEDTFISMVIHRCFKYVLLVFLVS